MSKPTQVTVKHLFLLCQQQLAKGNGDKLIVVADDNEGNGYHGMFHGFTEITDDNFEDFVDDIYDSQSDNAKEIIILG